MDSRRRRPVAAEEGEEVEPAGEEGQLAGGREEEEEGCSWPDPEGGRGEGWVASCGDPGCRLQGRKQAAAAVYEGGDILDRAAAAEAAAAVSGNCPRDRQ